MADTNPLREKLADPSDNIGRGLDLDVYSRLCRYLDPNTASLATSSVMATLAEFIGDGLLDANGQRWTPLKVTAVGTHPEEPLYVRCEDDETVQREWRTHPLFVLERSETDQ